MDGVVSAEMCEGRVFLGIETEWCEGAAAVAATKRAIVVMEKNLETMMCEEECEKYSK